MLLIIELVLLLVGIWVAVSGTLPEGFFRILFGKGTYELDSDYSRLYGLMLISPLPIALFVSSLLGFLYGSSTTLVALLFEYFYLVAVIIAAIVVARKIRTPVQDQPQSPSHATGEPYRRRSYGTRLLMMTGLVVLGCTTFGSIGVLVLTLASSTMFGVRTTGEFSQDVLPFIVLGILILGGSFGSYKLLGLLRA